MKSKSKHFIVHFYDDTGRLVAEERINIDDESDPDIAFKKAEDTALELLDEYSDESYTIS